MVEATYPAAFLVGLAGGVHCIGMCAGIVGALTLGLPERLRVHPGYMLPFMLAYNAGRIASYTVAGALLGGIGSIAAHLIEVHTAQRALQVAAGLFMLALGLYLGQWWQGMARVEQAGHLLWSRIQPLGRRLLPVQTPSRALVLGMLWGWLPCGLVYSVLIWAIAAGSAPRGALLMLSFGLGTLPALLAMGTAYAWLARLAYMPWVRRLAGGLVILLGLQALYAALR